MWLILRIFLSSSFLEDYSLFVFSEKR